MPLSALTPETRTLHRSSIIVDAHCDTLTAMLEQNRRLDQSAGLGHVDLPRLKKSGINVQFFAAFTAPDTKDTALRNVLEQIDLFHQEVEDNRKDIIFVKNRADLELAFRSGKIAALLAVEGGDCLEGSLGVLRVLYKLGVRSLTLTWNHSNELGTGAGAGVPDKGLTSFGAAVVEEMNRLGMLVDVSHLSEKGFWDVIRISRQPVIASHSNCSALCSHSRNLSDKQIRALSNKGGVIGINFVPDFLGGIKPSLNEVLNHIEHVMAVGGVDCAGLGSDFDGTDYLPQGLEDCTKYPVITQGLLNRQHHKSEIKKVMGGNFLRVLGQVLK